MLGWQPPPEGEPAHTQQLRPVVEDVRSANPGDLIAHHPAVRRESLLKMKRIRGVIDLVPVPGDRAGSERLGTDRPVPKLNPLLIGTNILEIAEPGRRAANEAAAFRLEHTQHPLQNRRIEEYVVVEIVHVGSPALFQQELPLLSHTTPRQVPVERHPVAVPFQRPDQRLDLDAIEVGILRLGLIRDDHVKPGEGLTEQAGQDHCQAGLPPVGGDEHVNQRHRRPLRSTHAARPPQDLLLARAAHDRDLTYAPPPPAR